MKLTTILQYLLVMSVIAYILLIISIRDSYPVKDEYIIEVLDQNTVQIYVPFTKTIYFNVHIDSITHTIIKDNL